MKKRVTSILCALALICGMLVIPAGEAKASDIRKEDAKTVLTLNDASAGKLETARSVNGAYLMEGDCSITKAGRGKIYVYASTTANYDVEYVGVIIYVERYLEEEDMWGQVDCWTVEDYNTYYVSTSKTLEVEGGYYYRTRAEHIAGPLNDGMRDAGDSMTDGIMIK